MKNDDRFFECSIPGQGVYFLSPDKMLFIPDDIAELFPTDDEKLQQVAETLSELYYKLQLARFSLGDNHQVENHLMGAQKEIRECLELINQIEIGGMENA